MSATRSLFFVEVRMGTGVYEYDVGAPDKATIESSLAGLEYRIIADGGKDPCDCDYLLPEYTEQMRGHLTNHNSKVPQTFTQRNNTLYALHEMWPGVAPDKVVEKLSTWRRGGGCGTTACFGGWVAVDPYFKAQGIWANLGGAPMEPDVSRDRYADNLLFGDDNIFTVRGCHAADINFDRNGTDHALVTNRLQWLLDHSEVMS